MHLGPSDLNAHDLNVLVYHPMPDEEGDPWGIPAIQVNGSGVDWMAGYYGAYWFPTAVFDGVDVIESTPTGEGAGAYQETYEGYRATIERRITEETPIVITLEAQFVEGILSIRTTLTPQGLPAVAGLVLRLVAYEDEVNFAGGNGITTHRFVVRAVIPAQSVDLEQGEATYTAQVRIPSFVDSERLGVVAIVQNTDEDAAVFEPKEVVQSATWTIDQSGPTRQEARGVLLELYSATWCAACVYGDTSADALADEFGIQGSRGAEQGFEYLRPVNPFAVGAAILIAVGGWFVIIRRRGSEKP